MRPFRASILVLLLGAALACGRYGPPIRAPEYRQEAREEAAAAAEEEEAAPAEEVETITEEDLQEGPGLEGATP